MSTEIRPKKVRSGSRVRTSTNAPITITLPEFPQVQARLIDISKEGAALRLDFSSAPEAASMDQFEGNIMDPQGTSHLAFVAHTVWQRQVVPGSTKLIYDFGVKFAKPVEVHPRLISHLLAADLN